MWLIELMGSASAILHWRATVVFVITLLLCIWAATTIANDVVLWAICLGIMIAGGLVTYFWELRPGIRRDSN